MVGIIYYTYLGNGEGLERRFRWYKKNLKIKKFDTYVFPELKKELEYASDGLNNISKKKSFTSRKHIVKWRLIRIGHNQPHGPLRSIWELSSDFQKRK